MADTQNVEDIRRLLRDYMGSRDEVVGDFRRSKFMANPTMPTRRLLEVMNLYVDRFLNMFPSDMTPLDWEAFSELIHMTTARLNQSGAAIPGRDNG